MSDEKEIEIEVYPDSNATGLWTMIGQLLGFKPKKIKIKVRKEDYAKS